MHNKDIISFERVKDPCSAMGIGKKSLIEQWLKSVDIENYIINDDYSIDVEETVLLSYKDIEELPPFIQFGKIKGDFWCNNNGMVSLRGCPYHVEGTFGCFNNKLTSLKGGPAYTGGIFSCFGNKTKFPKEDIQKVCKTHNN